MVSTIYKILGLIVVSLVAPVSVAAPVAYTFDTSHADITFTVSHLGFSNTHGRFNEFDGQLMLDVDSLNKSTVEITISTASLETSWPKRNDHLKTADFFNVEQFPEMVFVSTALEMQTDSEGKLSGNLTLLGQTHPVTLDVTVNKIAPHPRSKKMTAGFTATGVIVRSQWGMDKFVPGIADEIHLRLDMEASEG